VSSFDPIGVTGAVEIGRAPKPNFPYLEIRGAGSFGTGGVSLHLVSDAGERIEVRPSAPADGRWVSVLVPSPSSSFRIVATDANPRAWLAFSSPREVGRASHWAARLLEHGSATYDCGAVALAAMLGLALYMSVAPAVSLTGSGKKSAVAELK
jgi:hypothetical protein